MKNYTCLVLLLLPSLLFSSIQRTSLESELNELLDVTRKQKTLSQKLSKELLFVAADLNATTNLDLANQTAHQFDAQLRWLMEQSKQLQLSPWEQERLSLNLETLSQHWEDYQLTIDKINTQNYTTPEDIYIVAQTSTPLLEASNQCLRVYERYAARVLGNELASIAIPVKRSSQQCTLIQKMLKEYLFIYLQHDTERFKADLFESAAIFEYTLNGLRYGNAQLNLVTTDNTREINWRLKNTAIFWNSFSTFMELASMDGVEAITPEALNTVAMENMHLRSSMDQAFQLYASLEH